ncbi:MAG: cadherin-like domain-containing protein, partial [Desulfovibrionales bacterium]|nr:cadherin-like domain-containing protein [Desulfovibrionales bacterium]
MLEEIGHDFDDRINSGKDSAGDEGHAFASLLLTGDANLAVNQGRNDHQTLILDGQQVYVENAGPYGIAQIHYVPMPENQIYAGMTNVYTSGTYNSRILSIVAITATSNRTVVVYDHWEDGYEADINNPTQDSTKIWTYTDADGWFIDTNGDFIKNAGEQAIHNGNTIIANGRNLILKNQVPIAHSSNPGSNILFDASDRVGSTKAVSMSRAGWDAGLGALMGGTVNLFDVGNSGKSFVLPVGADTYYGNTDKSLYDKTSLYIMAYDEGATEVTIRLANPDGTLSDDTITRTLQQGESLYVNGEISGFTAGSGLNDAKAVVYDGTTITADKMIGVNILAGEHRVGDQKYSQNRWHSVSPLDSWGSSYFAPVATVDTEKGMVDIYFYNHNDEEITVQYEIASGTGSIVVAAHSGGSYEMPASAAHFYTADGKNFYAVASVDRTGDFEWSYSLVAEKTLTHRFATAWAPGNNTKDGNIDLTISDGPNAYKSQNGSPIWVTSTADTLLYVDANVNMYDGAGTQLTAQEIITNPDGSTTMVFAIDRLQSYRIFDASGARDQSGMLCYTKDGTLLTAAWGADSSGINWPQEGGNAPESWQAYPQLDMGALITPYPDYLTTKGVTEANKVDYGDDASNENGLFELSEVLEYTITVQNRAVLDLYTITLKDKMKGDHAEYIANSATLRIVDGFGNEIYKIDDWDGVSDQFPLQGEGYTLTGDLNLIKDGHQGLQIDSKIIIKYAVKVRGDLHSTFADDDYMISNTVTMSGDPLMGDPVEPEVAEVTIKVTAIDAPAQEVAEDSTITDKTFKLTNTKGLDSMKVGDTTFTLAELENASPSNPLTVVTTEGVLTIIGYENNATTHVGTVTYAYDPEGTSKDHTGGVEVKDTISLVAGYDNDGSVSGKLVINITDTAPEAKDDARILERDDDLITGNVYEGGQPGDVADIKGGDLATVTHIGTSSANEVVDPVNGKEVTGTYGKLVINADGSYTYDLDETENAVGSLDPGEELVETFTYQITDSDGDVSEAKLTITIRNTGVSVSDVTVYEKDGYAEFEVKSGTANDELSLELIDGTATGGTDPTDLSGATDYLTDSLEYFDGTNWVKYTGPIATTVAGETVRVRVAIVEDELYEASEQFFLKVTNKDAKTAQGTGTIKDNAPPVPADPNDPEDPEYPDQEFDPATGGYLLNGVEDGGPIAGKVFGTDPDDDDLTYTKLTDPTHGTVEFNADGSYTYTPDPDYNGNDSFTVKIDDGYGGEATTTVHIVLTPEQDAFDDSVTTGFNQPVTIDVLANDEFEG